MTDDNKSTAQPPSPEVLRGWFDIAAVLEVSEDTAQRYAGRYFDPLPIWLDHAERVNIYVSALTAWVQRQALHFHSFHALREAGKLPSQIRAKERERGKHPKRKSKVGVRATK